MLRRLAEEYLKRHYASRLNENCLGAHNLGFDRRYPGVWFVFGAHTCPKDCPREH